MPNVTLHITADDFGYCPERNAGIVDCFKSGGITDTSLMVNATYTEQAAKSGLKHGLTMGLHFNMSEGKPLTEASEIPSLLNESGTFRGKAETKQAAEQGLLHIEHVKKELGAQIERFKSLTGDYPRRVDGHQHVHVFPLIRTAFAEVLHSYNIHMTRVPSDQSLQQADWMSPGPKMYLKEVARHATDSLELFAHHGIRSSDTFIGSSLMSNLTLEHLSTVLAAVPSDSKSIELMVHPGYPNIASDGGCGCGPDDFSRDIWRQRELECLESGEAYLIGLFEDTDLCAIYAKRVTIIAKTSCWPDKSEESKLNKSIEHLTIYYHDTFHGCNFS